MDEEDDAAKLNEGWFPEVVSLSAVEDWPKLNPCRTPDAFSVLAVDREARLTGRRSSPEVELDDWYKLNALGAVVAVLVVVVDLESAILIGGIGPARADKVEACQNLDEGVPAAAVAADEEAKPDGWGAGPYPPTVVLGNKSKKSYRFGSL